MIPCHQFGSSLQFDFFFFIIPPLRFIILFGENRTRRWHGVFQWTKKTWVYFNFIWFKFGDKWNTRFLFAGRCDDFSRALGIHRVPYEHETDIEADTVNTRNQRLKNKTTQKYPVQTHFSWKTNKPILSAIKESPGGEVHRRVANDSQQSVGCYWLPLVVVGTKNACGPFLVHPPPPSPSFFSSICVWRYRAVCVTGPLFFLPLNPGRSITNVGHLFGVFSFNSDL